MDTEPEFYTRTMAGVYAQQGHYAQAAKIYRHLLINEPDREDLKTALAETEAMLAQRREMRTDPAALFNEWIRLIFKYNELKKLNKLSKCKKL
jgi:hypothetical protein